MNKSNQQMSVYAFRLLLSVERVVRVGNVVRLQEGVIEMFLYSDRDARAEQKKRKMID